MQNTVIDGAAYIFDEQVDRSNRHSTRSIDHLTKPEQKQDPPALFQYFGASICVRYLNFAFLPIQKRLLV